jgi:hypothetical protein
MINSLKGFITIDGKKVMTNDERPINGFTGEIDWDAFNLMREEYPICIDHEKDMISFKMLTKPASEGGDLRNCQLTSLIATGMHILEYLDNKFPCIENSVTLKHLKLALEAQEERTRNRINRNVEGENKL